MQDQISCFARCGCNSDTDPIVWCEQPAKRQKLKTCETKARFSPTSPVGSQESVLKVPKQGQIRAAILVTTKRCYRGVTFAMRNR